MLEIVAITFCISLVQYIAVIALITAFLGPEYGYLTVIPGAMYWPIIFARFIIGMVKDMIPKEPTEIMIDAAAEVIWNDRDARMGGPWQSRDPREIVVIQLKATAKAALLAAEKYRYDDE